MVELEKDADFTHSPIFWFNKTPGRYPSAKKSKTFMRGGHKCALIFMSFFFLQERRQIFGV